MEPTLPQHKGQLNRRLAAVMAGVAALCLLASGLVYAFAFNSGLKLNHKPLTAEEKPKYLGEISVSGQYPLGLLAANSRLYVTFYQDENVGIFSLSGDKIKTFPAKIRGTQGYPLNMVMLGDKLVITDFVNGTVGFFTPDGSVLDGFWTTGDKKALKPVGAAVFKNVLYVTDNNLLGFLAVDKKGEIVNTVKPEKPASTMYYPWGIAISKDGRAFITDYKGSRVKVFNCAGWYAYDFETGKGREILNSPEGIAIDGLDRVHVVDKVNNKVFVYDNFGKFLFTYGHELDGPTGIAVDGQNRVIYIADTEKQRISLWGY